MNRIIRMLKKFKNLLILSKNLFGSGFFKL
jgi:hypothetical protein